MHSVTEPALNMEEVYSWVKRWMVHQGYTFAKDADLESLLDCIHTQAFNRGVLLKQRLEGK